MKRDRPQRGNPHRLVVEQHVFPVCSIQRFVDANGYVSVRRLPEVEPFKVRPTDPMFCAFRGWDQRAEVGFMKEIEDDFQALADEVVIGKRTIGVKEARVISRFFALWHTRFLIRHSPAFDHSIYGVAGDPLSKDQEELLERNRVGFLRSDQSMPGWAVAGLQIQMTIDRFDASLRGIQWGVATACQGEFLLPDNFGGLTIVPLTPTICLRSACGYTEFSKFEVSMLNQLAIQSARQYYVARDLARCPL